MHQQAKNHFQAAVTHSSGCPKSCEVCDKLPARWFKISLSLECTDDHSHPDHGPDICYNWSERSKLWGSFTLLWCFDTESDSICNSCIYVSIPNTGWVRSIVIIGMLRQVSHSFLKRLFVKKRVDPKKINFPLQVCGTRKKDSKILTFWTGFSFGSACLHIHYVDARAWIHIVYVYGTA